MCDASSSHCALSWSQLTYHVTTFSGLVPVRKTLLRNLSGHFVRGTLNACLGPSGSGKTTLLKCLSGQCAAHLESSSQILLGSSLGSSPLTSYFIGQHVHESMVGRMTVSQILRYAFAFKNPGKISNEVRDAHIEKTLADLMVDPRVLKNRFAECSGGEQKRLAIAQELMALSKPDLLFLDEPTSGLDSSAALQVMSCLKELATQQRLTVVVSLHVPSSQTLGLCDQVVILSKGGVCLYGGPPGSIGDTLRECGCVVEAKETDQPPIETLIDLACQGASSETGKLLQKAHLASVYSPTPWSQLNPNQTPLISSKSFTLYDTFHQVSRIFGITFRCNLHSFLTLLALLFLCLLVLSSLSVDGSMAQSSGCYLLNRPSNLSCESNLVEALLLRENVNYQVYLLIYVGLSVSCTGALWYISILKVLRSEHTNGWYSLGTFYTASQLVGLLEATLFSLLASIWAYFLSGNYAIDPTLNWPRLATYLAVLWSFTVFMQSFGQLLGVLLMAHLNLAIISTVAGNSFMWLLNGIFIDLERKEESGIIAQSAQQLAVKYSSYGLLYSLFQLDRCNFQLEHSFIVQMYHLERFTLHDYIFQPLFNALLLRGLTFTLLKLRFSHFSLLASLSSLVRFVPICEVQEPKEAKVSLVEPRISDIHPLNGKIALAWRQVTLSSGISLYQTSAQASKEPILRQLNGQVSFGTLTALMGPSGAGKTSLLRVLNGQCKARLSSESTFHLSRLAPLKTAFITQQVSEHLMNGLTASQLLFYASKLKNAGLPQVDHQQVVARILGELALSQVANTKLELCSGGERKRLALAAELTSLRMPNLVLIDEPTSGLDSTSAQLVLSCLRQLSHRHGLALVVSLHQPTAKCLPLFDQLYVLARGGVAIYAASPKDLRQTLERVPIYLEPTQPAIETLIAKSCSNWNTSLVRQLSQIVTKQCSAEDDLLLKDTVPVPDGPPANRIRFSSTSLSLLLQRTLVHFASHTWTEWTFFFSIYLLYISSLHLFFNQEILQVTGCISLSEDSTSSCSWGSSANQTEAYFALTEAFKYNFFFSALYIAYVLCQFAVTFSRDLGYFTAEHRNGWYSTGVFYLVRCTLDLGFSCLILLPYIYIGGWLETVRPGAFPHLLVLFGLATLAAQGLARTVALLSRGHFPTLVYLSILLIVLFNVLANFSQLNYRLHYVYQLASHLVPTRYLFEAIMLLQYGFGRCAPGEVNELLYIMRLSDEDYVTRITMLLGNALFYNALALLLLSKRVRQSKRQLES